MSTREQKQALVKGKILVGIDVGKNKSWAAVRMLDGKVQKPFSFQCTYQSLYGVWVRLQELIPGDLSAQLVVGMEPTSVYWKPIAHFFKEKGVNLVLTSPTQTSIARQLNDHSPHKSDKKDARLIVDLMATATFMDCYLPEGVYANLRQLSSQKERLWKELQRHENYVTLLVEQLFPEYKEVFPKPMSPSSQAILRHVCTPEDIREAGVEQLTEWITERWSNKKKAQEKAKELFEMAESSVGMKDGMISFQMSIRQQFAMLDVLYAHHQEIEEELKNQLKEVEYAKYLLSLKELGEVTAARLLGEFGDLKRYNHPSQLHKMAGLNLYQKTSGETEKDESRIKRRISKRGRPRVRRILYYMALRAMQKESVFHDYFAELKERGKPFGKQAIAFERKILGIMHSLVHNEVMFDEEKWRSDRGK